MSKILKFKSIKEEREFWDSHSAFEVLGEDGWHIVEIGNKKTRKRENNKMTNTVATMTKEELREMIEGTIEQKLFEILGDPDDGLEIRTAVRNRLLRQKKAVAKGERGLPFEDVVRKLGLD